MIIKSDGKFDEKKMRANSTQGEGKFDQSEGKFDQSEGKLNLIYFS